MRNAGAGGEDAELCGRIFGLAPVWQVVEIDDDCTEKGSGELSCDVASDVAPGEVAGSGEC